MTLSVFGQNINGIIVLCSRSNQEPFWVMTGHITCWMVGRSGSATEELPTSSLFSLRFLIPEFLC